MANIHDFGKGTDKGNGSGSNGGNGTGGNNSGGNNTGNNGIGGMPGGIPIGLFPNGDTDEDLDIVMEMLINYNEKAERGEFHPLLHREPQMAQLMSILNTLNHPNALLIGDAGVGKTGIVEELARLIVTKDPLAMAMLEGYTIYELPVSNIVAGKSYVGQLEQGLKALIEFASNPDNKVILFVDEIHQLMSNQGSSNDKIAQILKPALSRKDMNMIGATTTQEAVSLHQDPAFSRRWSTVIVPELTPDQTLDVVKSIAPVFTKKHKVLLPDEVMAAAIPIADEYKQYGSHRPDTTLTLIDRAMSDARLKREKMTIALGTSSTPNGPSVSQQPIILSEIQLKQSAISLLSGNHKQLLSDAIQPLTDNLNNKIIGQDATKTELLDTVKRMSLSLTKKKRPVSFLLAGPTGTGKTEIVKQLAHALFGSTKSIITINMNEYSHDSALNNIIGSSAGYVGSESKRELPFDSLQSNPFQIVLLDEIEKAHASVVQYFMQALDEGKTKTNRNTTIDFSRTIIIATTNAGVEALAEKRVGFGHNGKTVADSATKTDIMNALKQNFKIEILNRFEHIIAFNSLSQEDFTKVLAVKYNKIIEEAIEQRPDLTFAPDHIDINDAENYPALVELAEKSYDPQLNGRPAERTIQKYIENYILDHPSNTQFTLL